MPQQPRPPLSYAAMRLRWCGLALLDFLRRWAVYVVVAAAVASAGAVGWHTIIAALAAWFVMPLFYAASQGAWLLLALPAQVAFGTGCLWAARNLLWPPHWAEAERALPIAPRQRLRSDLGVVLIALLPLFLLYAVGAMALLSQHSDWLRPVQGRAVLALLLAMALTVAAGVALLQRLRGPAGLRAPRRGTALAQPSRRLPRAAGSLRWPLPLVVWPLWRGPARRTGFAMAAGAAALLLPDAGLLVWREGEPWWLAACSLLALVVATRVNALARIEFAGLFDALAPLPLAVRPLLRARASLGLVAVLPGVLALAATAQGLAASGLRPAVLWTWVLVCLGICAAEVLSAPATPADKAGRWLFSLVACVCLATEVLA